MVRKYLIYTVLVLINSGTLIAQYYNTGQDPSSIKWKQINTEHFRFIFPNDYSSEALRTAIIFEDSYKLTAGRYGEEKVRKFPVIIHSHSIESNGYVAWAPKRIELYPLPGQNSIPLFHSSQLALHELIHVSQMQALRQGISRPLEYLFGEQIPGAMAIFTPYWFLEGEAVVSESVYSYSGRGRQPDFEKRLKAFLLDGQKDYSYDKLLSSSYKNYTPDYYQFGYQMTAYTLNKFGDDVFPSVLNYISRSPYTLNPFNIALKQQTGQRKEELFELTMDYLKENWSKADSMLVKSKFTYFDRRADKEYINYHSPQQAGRDSIVAVKASLSETAEFILLTDNGRSEEKLFSPGYLWPYRISVAWPLITWAENVSDPRWENRSYSLIKTLNARTGTVNVLSRKSRLFSPAISADGRLVAASESTEDYSNRLVILENFTGHRLREIDTPQNLLVVNPRWDEKNRIVFISSGERGEGIMLYDYERDLFETRLEPGNSDIQSVALRNDTVYYIASHSGIDNVFSLDTNGNIARLTSSRFGLSDLSFYGSEFLFSDYSPIGMRIGSYTRATEYSSGGLNKEQDLLQIRGLDTSDKLPYYTDYPANKYEVRPYRKWQHLFNFHSWLPFYADLNNLSFENIAISPGATLMSQNHLSTLTSSVSYEYLNKEHYLHTSLLWEGQYPLVELKMRYGGKPSVLQDSDSIFYPSSVSTGLNASAHIYLPLRFSSGRFYQSLYPSLRLTYYNSYIYEEESGLFDYGQLYTTARLYLANLRRMAYRDIWPRWGQVVDIYGTWVPGDREKYGPIKTIKTTLYTPGFYSNHAFRLMLQAEKQDFERFPFYNRISLPRGYSHQAFISSDLLSFSADYAMPLVYPDINIGSLLYLKRLRTSLFYDYSAGSGNYYPARQLLVEEKEAFSSFGVELLADFHLFRLPFGFTGGVQSAWLPEESKAAFKLIFNIDVFGFVIGKSPARPY